MTNTVVEEDSIWMAITDTSGDEKVDPFDNKFDNFTFLDDELFFFNDEDEENNGNILELTEDLNESSKSLISPSTLTVPMIFLNTS